MPGRFRYTKQRAARDAMFRRFTPMSTRCSMRAYLIALMGGGIVFSFDAVKVEFLLKAASGESTRADSLNSKAWCAGQLVWVRLRVDLGKPGRYSFNSLLRPFCMGFWLFLIETIAIRLKRGDTLRSGIEIALEAQYRQRPMGRCDVAPDESILSRR